MLNATLPGGVVAALTTPLLEDQSLDREAYVRAIHFALEGGVHGIAPMGSTGEGASVSQRVWEEAIELAIREADQRVPVYCGAIHSSSIEVQSRSRFIEKAGGRTVVSTPPFFMNISCQREIVRHYEALADTTDLDIVVYNMPMLAHVNVENDTMMRLADIPEVKACKDTSHNWAQHRALVERLEGSSMRVFIGGEEQLSASLMLGSHGLVAGYAALFPGLFVDLYEAARAGEKEKIKGLEKRIQELKRISSVGKSWISGMKYVAHRIGLGSAKASLPFEPLTEAEQYSIDAILEKHA